MPLVPARIALPAVSPSAVLAAGDACVVDLRSPSEFAEDHVPGARNVPLFDDVERAVIGVLYTRRSPEAAFREARARTRENVGTLVRGIAEAVGWRAPRAGLEERVDELTEGGLAGLERGLVPERLVTSPAEAVVLCCWRGGLRSRSVVALLRALGMERAVLLEGGYKGYRRAVREEVAGWRAPTSFVLRGLTGVGKTLVLREVERRRPGWTLDLEGLAGHRSSILGSVGLEPCSQKAFESRLAERVRAGFPGPCVVEGESRKVGDVILPETVWRTVREGTAIELVASPEHRVDVLVADYLGRAENRAEIARRLPFLEERLGAGKWGGRLLELLDRRRDRELVEVLLEHYYDPLYRHSEKGHRYAVRIGADDPGGAADAVIAWIEERAG